MPHPPIPLHRKLLYTVAIFGLFLLLAEGGLALGTRLYLDRSPPLLSAPGEGPAAGVVLVVGDSVTAGVGAPRGESWPEHLARALLRHRLAVRREALPGAGIDFAGTTALEALRSMPAEPGRPLVLSMLGHNDVLRWAPGARQGFERLRRDEASAARFGGGEAARWRGPRLVRALRWAWLASRPPAPAVELPAGLSARMAEVYRPLQAEAEARGGALVLLTYRVPGLPPAGLDPDLAAVIVASAQAQRAVNEAIRRAGSALGAEVIDLERALPAGEAWSLEVFVDHIHLSAEGHAQVAALLAERIGIRDRR